MTLSLSEDVGTERLASAVSIGVLPSAALRPGELADISRSASGTLAVRDAVALITKLVVRWVVWARGW